jgi:hypothetical protein
VGSKRLLGLWNALPGVEKRKKVGDRAALIDQLWSAIALTAVSRRVPVPVPAAPRPMRQFGNLAIDLGHNSTLQINVRVTGIVSNRPKGSVAIC